MAKLRELERTAWLERARDATSDAEVVSNLVAAWRAAPLGALVELARVAGARAAKSRDLPRTAEQDAYLAVAARHDPAELEWVIANLQTGRIATARERAEALATWPADPRIAPGLMQLMLRTQLRGRTTRPFWTIVFRIIHRQFHPGVAPLFDELDALGGDFGDYVSAKLRSLRRRVETARAEPPLDAGTRALFDAIAGKLEIAATRAAERSADSFLRDIWAAPLDLGLREVFADWLLARDDPRAEFIMLQMTRKRRGLDAAAEKRERELLREHARAWMGPLEPAVDRKQFRFEGGFLYACKVNPRGMTDELETHPAWSTVREYVLDTSWDASCDRWLDHMIALGAKRR